MQCGIQKISQNLYESSKDLRHYRRSGRGHALSGFAVAYFTEFDLEVVAGMLSQLPHLRAHKPFKNKH